MTILLNDLLQLTPNEIDNTKIKFNMMFEGNWDPIELFKNNDHKSMLEGHYFNHGNKFAYEENQNTLGFIRISKANNLWLLFHAGKVIKRGDTPNDPYLYEDLPQYKKYCGRLIIHFKNSVQANNRLAKTVLDQCSLHEILPDIFDNDIFPGYENVNISWKELSRVINKEGWNTALKNQKAIYLITDQSNGKMYVGSASGKDMLLQRWQNYLDSRHGGNNQLKKLPNKHIEENFKYSILEVFKSTTDDNLILQRESWWKNTLHTRKFGYNDN